MEDGNDKLKLLVLLCGEDDDKIQIAAAGALAMITAAQKKLCTKLTLVVRTIGFTFFISCCKYATNHFSSKIS